MELKPSYLSLPIALAAGLGTSAAIAGVPSMADGSPVPADHIANCRNDYAQLPSMRPGLAARILNGRTIQISAQVLDMHITEPACNDAEITRTTSVEVDQNRKRMVYLGNFINPSNDHGERIFKNAHTTRRLGCQAVEKVTFTTRAVSALDPNTVTTGKQGFSFRVACS